MIIDGRHNGRLKGPEAEAVIHNWLNSLLLSIGVKGLDRKLIEYQEGWLVFQIIAESHISLHAYPDGRAYVDIFSCIPFDVVSAVQKTSGILGLTVDYATDVQVLEHRLSGLVQGS